MKKTKTKDIKKLPEQLVNYVGKLREQGIPYVKIKEHVDRDFPEHKDLTVRQLWHLITVHFSGASWMKHRTRRPTKSETGPKFKLVISGPGLSINKRISWDLASEIMSRIVAH